jgi:hypothetical protein
VSEPNDRIAGSALGQRLVTSFVVAELLLLSGNLVARILQRGGWLPFWTIAVIAVLTVGPMAWFAIQFFRMLKTDLDEMIQRVALEGLAFAMVVFIPLAGLYVNCRAAGLLTFQLDPPELLLIPSILVAIGIVISWRRLK